MSKLTSLPAVVVALLAVTSCAGDPSALPDAPSESNAQGAESDLSRRSCDQNQLFVKQGLADDMRTTLGAAFVSGYQVRVPGAFIVYDSYGGDIVQAPLGASARADRAVGAHPGGTFTAYVGGHPSGNTFEKRGFIAAKALFDAMTAALETSTSEPGWTVRTRTSKGAHFSCVLRIQGDVVRESSCAFEDLLVLSTVSFSTTATGFCLN